VPDSYYPTLAEYTPSKIVLAAYDITVFVCWDPDLVPTVLSEPAEYPAARELVNFAAVTENDRLEYFARYTSASLGRVKNLYLDWARLKGPMSAECQQLNRLFSTCVDGNRIKVPRELEDLPRVDSKAPSFILDTLHEAALKSIKDYRKQSHSCDGYSFDAIELLLCRDDVAMSEFELIQLTYRWCLKTKSNLADFLHLFDFNRLRDGEKSWMLGQLPPAVDTPSLILNGLLQSNLIAATELRSFRLDHHGLRWKCVFDSCKDRLGTFLETVSRNLELFHRKLLVIRVSDRFTMAIYIPQKIEKRRECQVDDSLLLFAFPHSQGNETYQHRVVPTKANYRLYCDGDVFQLYKKQREDTWVSIWKAASDDSSYSNIKDTRDKRRQRQKTIDSGVNYDCKMSVALEKFSRPLQRHVGAVKRKGIIAAVS
jgi:RNA dependent RNA polymerase